ncbi:MAG: hypothetical protein K6U11_07010 [bacterium]|nr:hypothetical protein [bacterium]
MTFGGSGEDVAKSVVQTSDDGYIVAGYSDSFGAGYLDLYIVKLTKGGQEEWKKNFGGSGFEEARSIQQTSDGGYIVAGYTSSFGIAGSSDIYIVKFDNNGYERWGKTFGGNSDEVANSIWQTSDGGYVIAGYVENESYDADWYIIKLDKNGSEEWHKTFGGNYYDEAKAIQQTSDGGYIIAGYLGKGEWDVDGCLVKLDEKGNKKWDITFGGSGFDAANAVQQTHDGRYIVAGCIEIEITPPGNTNFYIAMVNDNGTISWGKNFGGDSYEEAYAIRQTSDDGYIVAGCTDSFGQGRDFYLVKLNRSGDKIWDTTVGGDSDEEAYSIQQTSDGGYIVAGYTDSFGQGGSNFYLVKLNENGGL